MTDHAKFLGIAFLAFGIINTCVLIIIALAMMFGMGGMLFWASESGDVLFGAAFGIIGSIVMLVLFFVFMALPHYLAGYAFLKRRKSSKILGVIASVFSFLTFPLGTALAIYCFWFVFSEQGNKFYGN